VIFVFVRGQHNMVVLKYQRCTEYRI